VDEVWSWGESCSLYTRQLLTQPWFEKDPEENGAKRSNHPSSSRSEPPRLCALPQYVKGREGKALIALRGVLSYSRLKAFAPIQASWCSKGREFPYQVFLTRVSWRVHFSRRKFASEIEIYMRSKVIFSLSFMRDISCGAPQCGSCVSS
jgi:hypothetical protein